MSHPDFTASRRAMINSQLRTSGVNEPWVIAAMDNIAREDFLPQAFRKVAYMDRSINLAGQRVVNPPLATGLMLQEAEIREQDAVMLIGGGTGYVARLLAQRADKLVVVENEPSLLKDLKANLEGLDNVEIFAGPLNEGCAANGPYDAILIDGAIEELPHSIVLQVAEGGRVVAGLIDGAVSRIAMGFKRGKDAPLRAFADCSISPLPGFARTTEFVF